MKCTIEATLVLAMMLVCKGNAANFVVFPPASYIIFTALKPSAYRIYT